MSESSRQHAKYSASSAHRWMRCHASVKLAATLPPPPTTPWAQDGTEAHALLEFALKNGYRNVKEASIMADRNDDDDRCDAVQVAVDYVHKTLEDNPGSTLFVEQLFKFPSSITDDAGGTNDILIVIPDLEMIYVIDYKHGAGIAVEAEENSQMLTYATGAHFNEHIPKGSTYILTIVQPRAFHPKGPIREWPIGFERLEKFVDEFDNAVAECESETAAFNPGTIQCKWCPAVLNCKAIEERAVQVARQDFKSVQQITVKNLPETTSVPVDRLAYIMQAADLLKDWLKEIEQYAYQYAMGGGYIPGYKLVEAQAKRTWYGKEEDLGTQLMFLTGKPLDEVMPRKLINITEADKLVKAYFKQQNPEMKVRDASEAANVALAKLTVKDTSGRLVLVEDTDKRPAVNPNVNAFAGVSLIPVTSDQK